MLRRAAMIACCLASAATGAADLDPAAALAAASWRRPAEAARTWLRRRLVSGASTCTPNGGGIIPEYPVCEGCEYAEAMGCVRDLRTNSSMNVQPGCDISSVASHPQKECCATFVDDNKRHTINHGSSAYADTLLCLETIGCVDSTVYEAVEDECLALDCANNTFKSVQWDDTMQDFSCMPTRSAGGRPAPPLGLLAGLGLALLHCAH